MQMKFIGEYTGGRTAITLEGVTFTGREPSEVPAGSRLLRHPEFAEAEKAINSPTEANNSFSAPRRGGPRK